MISTGIVVLLSLFLLVFWLISGTPMPIVFGGSCILIVLLIGLNPILIVQVGYSKMIAVVLLAIPLFVIGGTLMTKTRLGSLIVDWFDCFLGHIKGSMTFVATFSFALFSAVSGSGMAILSCLGPLLYKKLTERGYPPNIVAAMLCCAAPLGLLLPPSVTQIVYAWAANVSILACFLAIIIPGLMCTILLAVVSMIFVRRSGAELVVLDKKPLPQWASNAFRQTAKSVPGLAMPIIILGGIYGGIFTVTESAAVAAVYATIVGVLLYRDIPISALPRVFSDAGATSGVIMIAIFFIVPYSRLLLQEGVPQMLIDFLLSVSENRVIILLMVNLFMMLMGMVLDDICGVLIVATVLVPVMRAIGISPYHFAAIVGVNLGFGLITPPTAPFLFFTSRITGVPVTKMFKHVMLLILFVYIPVLILVTYIPSISLWIPQMVLGDRFSPF